ncbi:DUF3570 domain-containing protein [Agaribacterium sp. ZY112]|uniref:DUF3570 domain-containing protein n=1 Tax=Agaribacterium sp. ZY112 TaxID=3233574 RepID=UPI0035233BBE
MAVIKFFLSLCLGLISSQLFAAVLPDDQADVLYHRYEGGGITVDGPSVLVRKGYKDKISAWGNYYTDSISGASIDLLAQGSTYYEEERTETSVGLDYLHDKTIMSISATNSSERDYEANSFALSLSQDFFGDMSTFSMNYSQGNDEVRQNIYEDGSIVETIDRGKARHQRFGLGLSQVLTKTLIISANAEAVIDDGFLNNPYRSVRYEESDGTLGREPEKYPETRNSDAFALRGMYYLPYRAALRAEYRIYRDSWGIDANNWELRYIHPIQQWTLEAKVRGYEQSQADFYSDLFPYADAQNYRARDKEMSAFSNQAFGLGASYDWQQTYLSWADNTTLNLYWDFIQFDYQNFRENTPDNTNEYGAGNEPLYGFGANVIRAFISIKY